VAAFAAGERLPGRMAVAADRARTCREDRGLTQLIAGKYRLRAAIGRGPHGVVWHARHEATHERLAVKVLHAKFADDPLVVDRFLREESVLTAFLHVGYVRLRELTAEPERIALVTDLVAGTDLRQEITRSAFLSVEAVTEIAATCAETIAAGHRAGVVHCGIKPSNIMLTSTGQVRITDCRVARLARGRLHGPYEDDLYAAPELMLGGVPTSATDIYQLGLVLQEMLSATEGVGEGGSGGAPLPRRLPPTGVDSQLREIVKACLEPDPAQRPTGAQLAGELRAHAAHHAWSAMVISTQSKLISAAGAKRRDGIRPKERDPNTRDRPGDGVSSSGREGSRRRRLGVRTPSPGAGLVLAAAVATGLVAGVAAYRSDPPRESDVSGNTAHRGAPSLASSAARPALADAATAQTGDGAIAFARYWFDTLNHAAASGDTSPLAAASSPNCRPCAAAVTSLGEVHANGRSTRGGTYTVRSVHMDSFFDLRRPTLRVVFDRTPRTTVDASGQQVAALPGTTFESCQIVLEREGTQWRVLEAQSSDPVA
jgi:serine/threonine protein kinase